MTDSPSGLPRQGTDDLREPLQFMGSLIQEGCAEIASISRLALFCLQSQNAALHLNDIANALRAIMTRAEETRTLADIEVARVAPAPATKGASTPAVFLFGDSGGGGKILRETDFCCKNNDQVPDCLAKDTRSCSAVAGVDTPASKTL